jgi:excisionase family DNA binding protein
MSSPWLTASEVAGAMHCSTAHVYTMARQGKLPHVKMGSLVRFPPTLLTSMQSVAEQQIQATVLAEVRKSRAATRAVKRLRDLPNRLGL